MAVGWALRRPGRISARGAHLSSQRRLNLSWSFPFEAACWFSSKAHRAARGRVAARMG